MVNPFQKSHKNLNSPLVSLPSVKSIISSRAQQRPCPSKLPVLLQKTNDAFFA
jgi:hypothetical protein